MKRIFLGVVVAASLWGFAGCAEYEESDNESIREQCMKDPHLPFCDEAQDEPELENPSTGDDF